MRALYESLNRRVCALHGDIEVYTVTRYIGVHTQGRRVASLEPKRDHVHIWLAIKPGKVKDPGSIARRWQKHCSVNVSQETDWEQVKSLIEQAYTAARERTARRTGRS